MNTRLLYGFCGALVATLIETPLAHAEMPTASLTLTTYVGATLYRLTIEPIRGKIFNDELKIVCTFNCKSNVDFVERIPGNIILGAYPIQDGMLTLWAVGDGSLVRIYHIDDLGITKVLETPTRGQYPILTSTSNGQPVIIIQGKTAGELLQDQQRGVAEPTYSVQGDLWVWNGRSYIVSKERHP